MIPIPAGTQIWVACGATDMRRGFDGLAMLVQEVLKQNPYGGHLFVFRGKRAEQTTFSIPIAICRYRISMASTLWQAVAGIATIGTGTKYNN